MEQTEDLLAVLIKKTSWREGKYPKKDGSIVSYNTRMLIFVNTDTDEKMHINLTRSRDEHQKWNKLKVGDKITGFEILRTGIINPSSSFRPYSSGALF